MVVGFLPGLVEQIELRKAHRNGNCEGADKLLDYIDKLREMLPLQEWVD